jgi:hypothetical protein
VWCAVFGFGEGDESLSLCLALLGKRADTDVRVGEVVMFGFAKMSSFAKKMKQRERRGKKRKKNYGQS